MSKIKILSENLANQIAAGEVVERPASVVKELIENAIDAGAINIAIQVEGGGTRLIRVIDDGEGMDQDDILLSLERHATSKLGSAEQLPVIETLGFRGEAVPSIAAVSRMIIISRPPSLQLGTRVEINFGRIVKVHDMGGRQGTVIEIKNLFGNVPARKKFLKSASTELFHILEIIKNYALVCFRLGFSYSVDSKMIIDLAAEADTLEQRALKLMGRSQNKLLIEIQDPYNQETKKDLRVYGYLLPPEDVYGAAAKLRLFVNGRSVRDRMLAHAVAEGMHGFLMKGGRPGGAVFIELPPADVDVNVHPAKQEVKFHKSAHVHEQIVSAVRRAMGEHQQKIRHSLFAETSGLRDGRETVSNSPHFKQPWEGQPDLPVTSKLEEPGDFYSSGAGKVLPFNEKSRMGAPGFEVGNPDSPGVVKPGIHSMSDPGAVESSGDEHIKKGAGGGREPVGIIGPQTRDRSIGSLRLIGQLSDSYILCELDKGLVVIDQHAAHERIIFESFKEQYLSSSVARQMLLYPRVMELGPDETRILEYYRDEIDRMGIDIADFGGGSYVVKAVPAYLSHIPVDEILAGVFEQFGAEGQGGVTPSTRIDNLLATMACKAAIKANHVLQPEEIEELFAKMQKVPSFSHCPHGRPVMKHFSDYDIKKWFHRT